MIHNTLKTILASLSLVIAAGNPAWSMEPASGPAPGQFRPAPGYYPALPGRGHVPGEAPRSDWNSSHRYYPAPWSTPPYGSHQPSFAPRTQAWQTRPPIQTADSPDAIQLRLLAELDAQGAELDAARDELRQTRELLEDASQALDQAYKDYHQVTAGYAALDTQLATTMEERDRIRERETELSIELMAAERQLVQATERLEQLEKADLAHAQARAERERLLAEREAQLARLSERVAQQQKAALEHAQARAEQERLLAEREAQLARLEALVESRTAEASDSRSELEALRQQLALLKTEVQAAAEALTQAQSETALARTQRDEKATGQQACQTERNTLATALEQERRAHATRQRALEKSESARAAAEAGLTACNTARAAAAAELKKSQAQLEAMTATTPPAAQTSPVMVDGDADGIADSDDLCPDTPPGGSVGPNGCSANTPIILEGVGFRYDSHQLNAESLAILDRVAAVLRQQPTLRLEIAGHTDNQGNPAYNQWLSQQRAASVMDYLVKQGVKPDTLTARGYGSQQPIADNNTREGLARNRRVELRRLP